MDALRNFVRLRGRWLGVGLIIAAGLTASICALTKTNLPRTSLKMIAAIARIERQESNQDESDGDAPAPFSSFFQKYDEDRFWNHLKYDRTPILAPLTAGGPTEALDPPSDDEVLRVLEKSSPIQTAFPAVEEKQRIDVRIVKEKVADYIDPPRVYPLVGPAQVHHSHYKCTVYFTEVTLVSLPIPHTVTAPETAIAVYIDHNHLHQVGNLDGGPSSND